MLPRLALARLPFEAGFYRERNPLLPEALPFTLRTDPATGLVVQEWDEVVRKALKTYYEIGGYGSTPLGESAFGVRQAQEILDAMNPALLATGRTIPDLRFLEIGSSYGYLLYLLKQAGAGSVLGIEPGDEGNIGSKKYGIPLIQDFFPTPLLTGRFDVVFSHAVLEHIEDPLFILKEMVKVLDDNGVIFLAVPDCEKKFLVGDPSIISHQHVNYFTAQTLRSVLEQAGLRDVQVVSSGARSILYGWGTRSAAGAPAFVQAADAGDIVFAAFARLLPQNVASLQRIVGEAEARGATLGLYGASVVLRGLLHFSHEPRLFDTDVGKHGKRMTPSGRLIESPEELLRDPPDVLLICPIDYDAEIHSQLRERGLTEETTQLISLKQLFEQNSGQTYAVGSVSLPMV